MRKALSVFVVLGTFSFAGAQTLYDNIGSYTWGSSSSAPGWSVSSSQSVAQLFKPTASGMIGTITLGVQQSPGGSNPSGGTVEVYSSDSNGLSVQSSLGSTHFGSAPVRNSGSVVTVSGPAVSLVANTYYWLVVTPDSGAGFEWRYTAPATSGSGASRLNGTGPWSYWNNQSMGGFKIAAVPEPMTMGVLGFGILGMLRRRKAR